jgi:hypothetical protein
LKGTYTIAVAGRLIRARSFLWTLCDNKGDIFSQKKSKDGSTSNSNGNNNNVEAHTDSAHASVASPLDLLSQTFNGLFYTEYTCSYIKKGFSITVSISSSFTQTGIAETARTIERFPAAVAFVIAKRSSRMDIEG